MAEPSKRVLVIEHNTQLAELVQTVLDHEGYQTDFLLEGPDMVAQAVERQPDLLIVDLLYRDPEHSYQLLDWLRADPVASRIPVLAMAEADSVADTSLASYNVRATLVKPFDLDDLLDRVREALDQPPLHSTPPPEAATEVLPQAQRVLAERSREALFRWAQHLQRESPWKDRSDLHIGNLLDSVPVLVEAVAAALQYADPAEHFQRNPDVVDRLKQHAAMRRDQGIPLAAVVREYTLLRNELWELFHRYLPEQIRCDDLLKLERAVNLTLDRILELTIPAYLGEQAQPAA